MATKARIAIEKGPRMTKTIEVFSEGYPEYTGNLLMKYFNTTKKIDSLMALGDIDYLEKELSTIPTLKDGNQAQTYRFLSSATDLMSGTLADYLYLFKADEKAWYILGDDNYEITPLKDYLHN